MEKKKVITLDLTDCKYLGELHERIRVAFDFPQWYGANWDAFWDLLHMDCDADEVVVIGEKTMPSEFDSELLKMHKVLSDLAQQSFADSKIYDHIQPFTYRIVD